MPELGVYLVNPAFKRVDRRRFDVLRRIEIRFARAETANVDALGLHRFRFAVDRESEGGSQLSGACGNFHGVGIRLRFAKWERKLLAAVEVFNQRFEVILVHLDDSPFRASRFPLNPTRARR